MGKRAMMAFFLSLLVILGYNYLVAQKYPSPIQQSEEPSAPPSSELEPLSPFVPQTEMDEKVAHRAEALEQAQDIAVETDLVRLVITSSGARIKSCQLKRYPEEKIVPEQVQGQIVQIGQALSGSLSEEKRIALERQKGKLELLLTKINQNASSAELISLGSTLEADFSPSIILPDYPDTSLALNTELYQCSRQYLSLSQERPEGQLEFTYTDSLGRRVTKVFSFSNSNYGIGLDVSFAGWQERISPSGHFVLSSGPDLGLQQAQQSRRGIGGRARFGYQGPVTYFTNANKGWMQKEKYDRKQTDTFVQREHQGKVRWTGLENTYFLMALVPAPALAVESVLVERNRYGEQSVALKVPWRGPGPYSFQLYLGPKKEDRLKQIGASLENTIDYGFFSPVARLIYKLLVAFSRLTNNFGWAIVLLCLMIKVVFYPLTHHSFESMQKMQQEMKSIQPEMNELREKLKDSPQKLNKEVMALYRKKGINPLASCQSGCLPLLLQMPVFFALYAVLYNSIELRGTPFFGWITDLSAKDPYYVLPILMGVSMFVQQKLTGMGATGGAQQDQAKMMAFFMPIFLTWIFASLPSGVVLYWLTFNIFTAAQQLLIRKKQAQSALA